MKVFNTYYETKNSLKLFISENNIINSNKILVQVFTGICDMNFIQNLIDDIKYFLPDVNILGSTTDGEILNSEVSKHKTVLSFSCFEDTQILTYSTNILENSYKTASNLIEQLKSKDDLKLVITFSDGIHTNGQDYVKAFEDFNNDLIIAGGLAGDNAKFDNTYVFTQDGVLKSGAVVAGFYNKNLLVHSNYNFNWESIGKTLVITKAIDNIVYTIDNIPAADVYEQYLGKDIKDRLPATGIEFPLILKRDGIDVARAVLAKYDDGSLMFAGTLNNGEKVQFGFGNIQAIIENRLEIAYNIALEPTQAIYVYSCMARKHLLDTSTGVELNPIAQIAQTSGFFTYGEIYHNAQTKTNNLLNQTLTTVSISESNERIKHIIKDEEYNKENTQTIKALCHLTSVASRELYELNETLEDLVNAKTYQLRVKNKELLRRFYYDELTTLGNRNLLLKDISNTPKKYSLVSIDINNFKNINDLYGVDSGDKILKQFAKLINESKESKYCRVFRVSGNEFAILNKKPTTDDHTRFVKYLNDIIQNYNFFINYKKDYVHIEVSITIGIAYKTNKLIEKAHLALIDAKKENVKFKVYINDLKLEKKIINNMKYTQIIKEAIRNDNVIVYFQAIFKNDKIHKYETLMRIEHDGKIINPFEFLHIAKKNGDYLDLTKMVIEKSFKIFEKKDKNFSINLSFEDIENEKIVSYLKEQIDKYKVANKLIIEILEDESIKNYDLVKNFVFDLKKMGVKIALDDFGSGYSNFSRVLELNVDFIKIDGSIISTIDTNKNSYIIAQTITEFSKKLGIKTIAEYIHSEPVYSKAKELGIDEFQGFLLGMPKPLD